MVENHESETQSTAINNSALPESNPKPDTLAIIRAENSIEVGEHTGKESPPEKPSHAAQISGQTLTSVGTSSSTGKQSNVEQTADQTTVSSQTDSFTRLSDQEIQEIKQKDEQQLQKVQEKLQQIRGDTGKPAIKSEDQPTLSSENSSTTNSEANQDYDRYQGYGH